MNRLHKLAVPSCTGIHSPNLGANNVAFMIELTKFFGRWRSYRANSRVFADRTLGAFGGSR